jgi:hypothetical protein
MDTPYFTDPIVKEKIDYILKKSAVMMANLGTKTNLDVGDIHTARKLERQWLEEVKELDKEMYLGLVPQIEEE